MSYKFADHLLLRMPVKNWAHYRDTHLQALLTDAFFLAAIYIASPGFYTRLARAGFDHSKLNARERDTLKKYHNRICFRCTPFGLFSAVALAKWGDETTISFAAHPQPCTPHIEPDQAYVMAFSQALLDNELKDAGLYLPNPTLYRAGNEYRFVYTMLNEGFKTRSYDLRSAGYSSLLKKLLKFCERGVDKGALLRYVTAYTSCSVGEAEEYFQFMAHSQIIVSNLQANITGQAYLQRLLEQSRIITAPGKRVNLLNNVLTMLVTDSPISPAYFTALNEKLKDSLGENYMPEKDELLNITLVNKSLTGTLGADHKQNLADALFALDRSVPREQPKTMTAFIKEFKKRFDQQSIPLLQALDPETGIAYQVPDVAEYTPLLQDLQVQKRPPKKSMEWTAAHRYLLNCWHNAPADERPVIHLQESELLKLGGEDTDPLILGLSVLFRIADGKIIIDTAGGTNTGALIGRFTGADPKIARAARQMAADQETANPDIIFAELAHMCDTHADNVNRREQIWKYEIPITATSVVDEQYQVKLSDLYVSLVNDKVVLWSARHQKMVIPRLSSAYNYIINKLPLFCFLADIPYQFGRTHCTLELMQFFPGLSFYPRVVYKQSILYLATWILDKDDIALLDIDNEQDILPAFHLLSQRLNLPAVFSLVQGDQQIVFFSDRADDILLLADMLKGRKDAILKEYLLDKDTGVVTDAGGKSYITQFNAFIYTDVPLQLPPVYIKEQAVPGIERRFALGSDWLYLKIYLPKATVATLLLQLSPLLTRVYHRGGVQKWFFVRYEDNAPHIRLRMKLAVEDIGEILAAFKQKLEKSIRRYEVHEYLADTYDRELERYRAGDMDLTEDLFWRSSQLVLQFLRNEKLRPGAIPEYIFALYTMRDVLNVFLPDQATQILFTQVNYQQFMLEFDDKKITFELDKRYRDLSKTINATLRDSSFYKTNTLTAAAGNFIKAAKKLSASVSRGGGQYQHFLASVIHMHLNRVFTDEPRKQEMIVYYFLHKYLVSDMARKKK